VLRFSEDFAAFAFVIFNKNWSIVKPGIIFFIWDWSLNSCKCKDVYSLCWLVILLFLIEWTDNDVCWVISLLVMTKWLA